MSNNDVARQALDEMFGLLLAAEHVDLESSTPGGSLSREAQLNIDMLMELRRTADIQPDAPGMVWRAPLLELFLQVWWKGLVWRAQDAQRGVFEPEHAPWARIQSYATRTIEVLPELMPEIMRDIGLTPPGPL